VFIIFSKVLNSNNEKNNSAAFYFFMLSGLFYAQLKYANILINKNRNLFVTVFIFLLMS